MIRGTEPAETSSVLHRHRLFRWSLLLGAWLVLPGPVLAQDPPSPDRPLPETAEPAPSSAPPEPVPSSVPPAEPAAPITSPAEATPSEVAARVEPAPPEPASTVEEEPEPSSGPDFTLDPGRGFTVSAGDAFSLTVLSRIQLRSSITITGDDADPDGDLELGNDTQIRTLRLWLRGSVLDPHVRYGIQLAFGGNDFETLRVTTRGAMADTTAATTNPSPIFDAFLELTHLRDLSVRFGQFFVPFDRARTIREFALQSVDRAEVIRELTLDRDVGIAVYSNDLFGWGGRLGYQLGVFGGDGRNRFGTHEPGFLYVARVSVRPMGSFDEDVEGDLVHTAEPRLMIGGAFAFNHQTDRRRSTYGDPYEIYSGLNVSLDGGPAQPRSAVTFDTLHAAADLAFKWQGFYLLSEVVWRQATTPSHVVTFERDATTVTSTLFSRDAWGYLVQVSYATTTLADLFQLEAWGRFEQMVPIGPTDPELIANVNARGHGVAGGINFYFNGHQLKAQLDWTHSFGDDFGRGPHTVRLQLDASF